MALPHSINLPALTIVIIVVLSIGVLVVGNAFCGPSRTKMVADVDSLDVLNTVAM